VGGGARRQRQDGKWRKSSKAQAIGTVKRGTTAADADDKNLMQMQTTGYGCPLTPNSGCSFGQSSTWLLWKEAEAEKKKGKEERSEKKEFLPVIHYFIIIHYCPSKDIYGKERSQQELRN
jgi:hypothetical protein